MRTYYIICKVVYKSPNASEHILVPPFAVSVRCDEGDIFDISSEDYKSAVFIKDELANDFFSIFYSEHWFIGYRNNISAKVGKITMKHEHNFFNAREAVVSDILWAMKDEMCDDKANYDRMMKSSKIFPKTKINADEHPDYNFDNTLNRGLFAILPEQKSDDAYVRPIIANHADLTFICYMNTSEGSLAATNSLDMSMSDTRWYKLDYREEKLVEGEYLVHYDDGEFTQHFPATIDLGTMTALVEDSGSYWEPNEPIGNNWGSSSWCEIVFNGKALPAVEENDEDGTLSMSSKYKRNEYVIIQLTD